MFLKKCFLAVPVMAVVACAQQPVVTLKTPGGYPSVQLLDKTVTYASAANVAALIGKEKETGAKIVAADLLKLSPHAVYLEYNGIGKVGDVGLHPDADKLIYVIQGSGTLVTGGTVTAGRMSIEGGQSQKIGKGDVILVPAGVPHWITQVDQTVVLMAAMIPRAAPAQ